MTVRRWIEWAKTASACAAVGVAALVATAEVAIAKIPGATHCYFGICHRVRTLDETKALVGRQAVVISSYYDDCRVDRFNPCALTSSGEVFRPDRPDNAASPIYPDGTTLLVWNPKTKAAAIVRVNSAGPYHSNRTLDVSRATAERLGFKRAGVASLKIQVLSAPTPQETRYKKHREYPMVAGPIGQFASFETAAATGSSYQQTPMATMAVASARPLSRGFRMTKLPISNAKVVNAAGRNATIASMANIAGVPGLATAMSAGAIFMNAIPYRMLPAGIVTDEKPPRINKASRKGVAARQRRLAAQTRT